MKEQTETKSQKKVLIFKAIVIALVIFEGYNVAWTGWGYFYYALARPFHEFLNVSLNIASIRHIQLDESLLIILFFLLIVVAFIPSQRKIWVMFIQDFLLILIIPYFFELFIQEIFPSWTNINLRLWWKCVVNISVTSLVIILKDYYKIKQAIKKASL